MKIVILLILSVTLTATTEAQQSPVDSITTAKPLAKNVLGTWVIDLRPTPDTEPYLKEFKFTKIEGKQFDGEFYGYPFTGGFLNLDWDKIYFAFTTADQSGTYFHSGYVESDKIFGITLNENRKLIVPWKGKKKTN
jgi:hypothetical protein